MRQQQHLQQNSVYINIYVTLIYYTYIFFTNISQSIECQLQVSHRIQAWIPSDMTINDDDDVWRIYGGNVKNKTYLYDVYFMIIIH